MNRKKGFTLVELVAVIALLAVILLLVVPNIVNVFNRGKITSFANMVQDIYKQAEKDYSVNHIIEHYDSFMFCDSKTAEDIYDLTNGNFYCDELSFNDETAKFLVRMNDDGSVSQISVGSGDYCYIGYGLEVQYDDIEEGELVIDDRGPRCVQE